MVQATSRAEFPHYRHPILIHPSPSTGHERLASTIFSQRCTLFRQDNMNQFQLSLRRFHPVVSRPRAVRQQRNKEPSNNGRLRQEVIEHAVIASSRTLIAGCPHHRGVVTQCGVKVERVVSGAAMDLIATPNDGLRESRYGETAKGRPRKLADTTKPIPALLNRVLFYTFWGYITSFKSGGTVRAPTLTSRRLRNRRAPPPRRRMRDDTIGTTIRVCLRRLETSLSEQRVDIDICVFRLGLVLENVTAEATWSTREDPKRFNAVGRTCG
ncbi:hypothetical protein EVAR_17828_1 [Eumeta japonica]|uniref:Uncharacterized protein n=1 Tax=Eumeta variegata TaxID=151549 RepID=A0A4C1TTJ4_EUMVA|nr:hypothetical protein EVAR_17828_1 [Eumeta japonica]